MKQWLRKKLINLLVKRLFNGLTEDDVLKVRGKNVILYKGFKLKPEKIESIKVDAKTFRDSVIWKLLSDDMKYVANKRMFEVSESMDDMMAGKMVLYTIDLINKKLDNLSKL